MGNVQKHIDKVGDPREGDISMDYFLATIDNDEARQYVPKVMKAMGGPMDTLDVGHANDLAADMPEDESKMFLDLVNQQNEYIETKRKEEIGNFLDDLFAMVTPEKGLVNLPTSMKVRMNNLGLKGELDEYGKYSIVSDSSTSSFLYNLEPQEFKKLDLNTPGIRLKLTMEDYDKWVKKQKALDDPAIMVTEERRNRIVNNAFNAIGLSTRTDEGMLRKNNLNRLLDTEIDGYVREHQGRSPNLGEIQGMVDSLMVKGDYDTKPWWPGGGNEYLFDIAIEDIPKKDLKAITEQLVRDGVPLTNNNIITEYINAAGFR